MLSQFHKYAFMGNLLRRSAAKAPGPVSRNLDRLGKGALLTIPVAGGVSVAKKTHDKRFDPDNNAASFGLQRVE
jgi:hypothetical protein